MESKELYVVEISKNAPKILPIDPFKANDPFYRYKMRQLVVQVVGKGKMIKTAMTNLDDVATDLQIPAHYIPHYFGKSIGATAKYDESRPERERGSISGEYDVKQLSDVLKKFVKAFVICPGCSYPEYQYTPKAKTVAVKCKSCGYKNDVKGMDLNEKFKRYVINNPPPKPVKIEKPQGTGERRSKKPATNGTQIGKDDWSGDTSKEAVKARMDALVPTTMQAMISNPTVEGAANEVSSLVEILKTYASTHKVDEISAEIARMTSASGITPTQRTQLIVDALLLGTGSTLGAAVTANKTIIAKYISEEKGQQSQFLQLLEAAYVKMPAGEAKESWRNKFKDVLYLLHDGDMLDEDEVFAWDKVKSQGDGKALRTAVAAFVKWLKEAEEEEEEESDEEGEKAVNGKNGKTVEVKGQDQTSIDDEIDAL